MDRILKVQLIVPPVSDLIHKFKNFGEDVYRALREECEISIREIDSTKDEFHLRGIRKRDLRTVAAKVCKIVEKRGMSGIVSVSEIQEADDE